MTKGTYCETRQCRVLFKLAMPGFLQRNAATVPLALKQVFAGFAGPRGVRTGVFIS
jgi:hypothetical protein